MTFLNEELEQELDWSCSAQQPQLTTSTREVNIVLSLEKYPKKLLYTIYNCISLPKGTSTLRPLEGAMGTPPA